MFRIMYCLLQSPNYSSATGAVLCGDPCFDAGFHRNIKHFPQLLSRRTRSRWDRGGWNSAMKRSQAERLMSLMKRLCEGGSFLRRLDAFQRRIQFPSFLFLFFFSKNKQTQPVASNTSRDKEEIWEEKQRSQPASLSHMHQLSLLLNLAT